MSVLGSAYGYTVCDECGVSVPQVMLQNGTHHCHPTTMESHQVKLAHAELDTDAGELVTLWLAQDPQLRARTEFYRWLEAR